MFIVLSVPNDEQFYNIVVAGVFETSIDLADYAVSYVKTQWPDNWEEDEEAQLQHIKMLKHKVQS